MKEQNNMAKLALNKSLLKEYSNNEHSRIVYLKNGDEFQIQLFNPKSHKIGVRITLNNEPMYNLIVLKPGERVWLERYLDNPRKFLFSTYEVEDSKEAKLAIKNNGNVKIEFFNETKKRNNPIQIIQSSPWQSSNDKLWYNHTITCDGITNAFYSHVPNDGSITSASNTATMDCCLSTSINTAATSLSSNIETGMIEEGSYSNQTFINDNTDFDYYPFKTENIKILPMSQKPVSSSDLQKIYCYECGRKLKQKFKYCPYCGTKQ